ncbi:MAG: DEAD/DEAH box helicase, partial [Bacteroidota bacterium]
WEPHLRQFLGHIGGYGGGVDFSNLAVFSHTDLSRKGSFPERFRRIADLADVVIIDEAHHFRNPGMKGEGAGAEDRSRYYRLYDLLDSSIRRKTLYMLTATPINNHLSDFRHMMELFTRNDDTYFSRTLGVNNLVAHFNNMEKVLRRRLGELDEAGLGENLLEVQESLLGDAIFRHLVVQRSRAYARQSQIRETGKAALFPERKPPQVAAYSIRKTYGRLLDMFERAFRRKKPLFTLPMYYPLAWYTGSDKTIDPFEETRQKEVVGLIRTQFLKRFESSVAAFEMSCDRLMKKLLAFLEVHSDTDAEKKRLERWKSQNASILHYATERQLEMWGGEEESDLDDDVLPEELLSAVNRLDRESFDVSEMIQETFLDLDQVAAFLNEARKFEAKHDDKVQELIRLLRSRELADHKVLVFTEFADTARYIERQIVGAGIDDVAQVDSGTKVDRAGILRRFSPYYNGETSAGLRASGLTEIRVLISTDVLSEGLNLQDAVRMINYDIHWNPVRLMQRIGRVDRRMNPEVELALLRDHPDLAGKRGKVEFWNFLPPDEINSLLTLYTRVTQKTLMISKTLGIEGKKLLTPEDDYEALKEFNHSYEGVKSVAEELQLEYQRLLSEHPGLCEQLNAFPGSVFSGRRVRAKRVQGVFLCYALPALDKESREFSVEAGATRWYLYDMVGKSVIEDPGEIASHISSDPATERYCVLNGRILQDIRGKVSAHIRNTYLKRIQAPSSAEPILKAWMELSP